MGFRSLLVLAVLWASPRLAFAQDAVPSPEVVPTDGLHEGDGAPGDGTEAPDVEADDEAPGAPDVDVTEGEPEVDATEGEPESADESTAAAAVPAQATDDEVARPPDASASATEASGDARAAGEVRYDIEANRWVEPADPLWWRNTTFHWDHSVSLDTFLVGARRSYNPTYIQSFTLSPRAYVADHISVRLEQSLHWELTHNDLWNNSAWLSDLSLSVVDTIWFTLPGEVWVGGGVGAVLPVSDSSRYCGLVTGLGGHFGLTKVFDDVLTGLAVKLGGGLRGNIYSQDVCSISGGDAYGQPVVGGPVTVSTSGSAGQTLVTGRVGTHIKLAIIPELSLSSGYFVQWSENRSLADSTVPVVSAPGGTLALGDGSNTHTRVSVFFSLAVTYLVTDWVNLTLSYSSFNSGLDGSGNVYSPFYNPASQFGFGVDLFFDRIYQGVARMTPGD